MPKYYIILDGKIMDALGAVSQGGRIRSPRTSFAHGDIE